ncbi:hypothetical protein A0H81_00284 [Grifola frondosa]|uniref:Uncharacterized protein n=1 Tax=Grifola frondosa TaxID=5627 RepID=A0A1C7MRP8_GRIFR|nr:hypothetical protein A0H81_00284 [Grifola frondosa]
MVRNGLPPVISIVGFLYLAANHASAGNVTWTSPSSGDVYGAGDTIVGQWDADEPVASPSFRLCTVGPGDSGDEDNCGTAVWPTIQQSDGSYSTNLSLPEVSTTSECYLEMMDDSGDTMVSPTFSVGPSDPNSDPPDPNNNATTIANADSNAPSTSFVPSTPQSLPYLEEEESHMPVPTAAYAVPLSLVISVILAAGGLAVHHRRKLRSERLQEKTVLKTLSRQSTMSFRTLGDLGSRASRSSLMRAWRRDVGREDARGRRVHNESPPLTREPRRATRAPFFAHTTQPNTIPAGAFRAVTSPVSPMLARFSGGGGAKASDDEDEYSVVSRYLQPSPVPPSPRMPISRPERLHTRTYSEDVDFEKPLPPSPLDPRLYDVVTRRLSAGYRREPSSP